MSEPTITDPALQQPLNPAELEDSPPPTITDEELAEIEQRFERAERWQWQIASCGESLEDIPRIIGALRAERQQVARLRQQNKESSDRWTQRTRQMESDLARFRTDRKRALEWMRDRPSADGFGYSENDRIAVAAALSEVERMVQQVATLTARLESSERLREVARLRNEALERELGRRG